MNNYPAQLVTITLTVPPQMAQVLTELARAPLPQLRHLAELVSLEASQLARVAAECRETPVPAGSAEFQGLAQGLDRQAAWLTWLARQLWDISAEPESLAEADHSRLTPTPLAVNVQRELAQVRQAAGVAAAGGTTLLESAAEMGCYERPTQDAGEL